MDSVFSFKKIEVRILNLRMKHITSLPDTSISNSTSFERGVGNESNYTHKKKTGRDR